MKLHHVEKKWERCLEELDEEFYNCYGEFDATIGRKTHSNLTVSGPMVDVNIKELGSMILVRLSKGRLAGIQQSSTILIPWQVYVNIIKLIKGYGRNIATKLKKKHHHNTTYSELCKKDLECEALWAKFLVKRKVFQIFATK